MGKNFRKKMTRSAKQIEWGDPLVLPGMVCYAEKQGKPFWSRSLGQIMQFDTIIFGRTFKNYFGQFVWIENKPGPAQVGAISKAQKIAKRLPSVKYSFTVLEKQNFLKKNVSKKLHTQKNAQSGAPGLASASPWRAKVSQCRKTERGTL